jgi:tetratricopeptide (TPR) repeat protein
MAQAAAAHLEAVRQRFASLGLPPPENTGRPVIALIFTARQSLYPYTPADSRDPALTGGLSLTGEEQRWIAVAWETPGSPLTALAHEYAHLSRQDLSDPLWLREGLAEYVAGLPPIATSLSLGPAAEHHLRLLREQPWTRWEEFLAADRKSAAFARPNFYSQAWLAVHWLVARGAGPAQLQPVDLESLLRTRGGEWVDTQVRAYLEQLVPKPSPKPSSKRAKPSPKQDSAGLDAAESKEPPAPLNVRQTEGWELPYWKAEFHRELDHWEQSRPALEGLEREYPEIPEPSAALGALAMAQGRYELAEEKLGAAVRKGSRTPPTLHRYSLMLLRPLERGEAAAGVAGDTHAGRVGRAIQYARQAREANPHEPRYVLGEAQALLVGGLWDPAARLLLELQRFPGWSDRSEVEFAELLRRRQQQMRNVPAPTVAAELRSPRAADEPLAALLTGWWTDDLPEVPRPKPPARAEFTWPPPGTVLLYGYIQGVECRATEKIVTVRTPRFTIALREKAASPAKLYRPPSRWTQLPCGLRGREVNVVYRPLPPGGEVLGELVAVVF